MAKEHITIKKMKKIMKNFIDKLMYVFGNVSYTLRRDHRGVLKCRIPRIVGEICRQVYGVNSFGTFDSRVPKMIFDLNQKHKVAFILTAIIDEGSITYAGDIMFGVSNKLLCEDVRELCSQVDLETTKTTRKANSNHYYFYIKSKDRLLKLMNLMEKKYPLISLHYKKDRLCHYFRVRRNRGLHTREFGDSRKKDILYSLKKRTEIC